jgi:hypothetical protein
MAKTATCIWCKSGLYWDWKDDWSEGSWTTYNDGGVKYIRADAEAELEKALQKLKELANDNS